MNTKTYNRLSNADIKLYGIRGYVDLTKLSSGIYTVSLMGDGQRIATKKLNLLD